jgi:hypothetical protein
MRALFFLVPAFLLGCFEGDGAHEVKPPPQREAARAREAGRWAGTYAFEECAGSACSKYVFVVTRDGNARVTTDGGERPLTLKARPRVENDRLRIAFVAYEEEGPDVSQVGLRTLDPIRGRFMPGDPLATITRDTSGRACVTFEKLETKAKAKTLCSAAPE